jgi:hypothetical protein
MFTRKPIMATQSFTLIDAHATAKIDVLVEAQHLRVSPASLQTATGWSVKPEGFCRGAVCVPAGSAVTHDGSVDLAAFATLMGRPLVVDLAERAIGLGAAAADRSGALRSLEAPDFTLPDLSGQLHSLSHYRGKKILLAAYASW